MKHGIYFNELSTELVTPVQIESGITAVIGTAPVHLTNNENPLKPVLAYNFSEAAESLGYSSDFDKYTLCEAMNVFFSLYNVTPVVFINVLDPARHFTEKEVSRGGVTNSAVTVEGDIDIGTVKITSGEKIAPTVFEKNSDYEIDADEEMTHFIISIRNGDLIKNNKVQLSYTTNGGAEIASEVIITDSLQITLPFEIDTDTLTIKSGGVDTLQNLTEGVDYTAEYSNGVLTITALTSTKIVDDTIKIAYHEIDASKVTAADIIGTATENGVTTGLEALAAVHGIFNVVVGTVIAPKYSRDLSVTNALTAKAKAIGGVFPAMAIADIDAAANKNYQEAVQYKRGKLISDANLALAYPQVSLAGVKYNLSTHLAALLNLTDANNDNIPYVSPSNQTLMVDSAILADGTEIYLTRDQANYLNENGIVTAIAFNGWKAFGNYTSCGGDSNDVKNYFIPIRRMFNFVATQLMLNYFSNLDAPINRRQIDSVLNSANIYLNALVSKGALLSGQCYFNENSNPSTELMAGHLTFDLLITPPSPAEAITFILQYDTNGIANLFA